MLQRMLTIAISLFALSLAAAPASAQRLPEAETTFDATVLDVNVSERTITVEIEANEEIETYPVSKDAEIFTYDGVVERPQTFSDLRAGQKLMLEFDGIEGKPTLKKITSDDS